MRRPKRRQTRDAAYAAALRKLALAEQPTAQEARELRRRQLRDGFYPLPQASDRTRRLPYQHFDPRLA